jgi:hypothetical protein
MTEQIIKKQRMKTYCINYCFCWSTEEDKGTLNQAPVALLRGYKVGLVAISF